MPCASHHGRGDTSSPCITATHCPVRLQLPRKLSREPGCFPMERIA